MLRFSRSKTAFIDRDASLLGVKKGLLLTAICFAIGAVLQVTLIFAFSCNVGREVAQLVLITEYCFHFSVLYFGAE